MRPTKDFAAGYSFIELAFALGVIATIGGIAVPQLQNSIEGYRAAGAARYLSSSLQRARMEAVTRSAEVGLRFTEDKAGYAVTKYLDSNRNGVLSRDITNGIDVPLGAPDRLGDAFQGIDFGVLPGLPPVDAGGAPPGADPIKLGASNILAFSPGGTSSSGSIYVLGRGRHQYVVRIYGETGKTRVLKFNISLNQWLPL
jgi:type II secretory pathway pseudopilin PulG